MNDTKSTTKKIAVLIPCYNEEGGIPRVLKSFPHRKAKDQGYSIDVFVIDNNSSDRTADVARAHGASVLYEPIKGKGNAIRRGFASVPKEFDYVVMLDGDNTYRPEEILRLIEPIDSGFCNVVIGSRLIGRMKDGSMTAFNRFGNWMYSYLVRWFYGVNVTDVLTGYFAWKREAMEELLPHLKSNGFAIEMEMVTKMARLGEEIYSVPVTYDPRIGHTNLSPVSDGTRILWMFTKNLHWRPIVRNINKKVFSQR
jgi:glycosyltransferase involved in cell wall biosynthesis